MLIRLCFYLYFYASSSGHCRCRAIISISTSHHRIECACAWTTAVFSSAIMLWSKNGWHHGKGVQKRLRLMCRSFAPPLLSIVTLPFIYWLAGLLRRKLLSADGVRRSDPGHQLEKLRVAKVGNSRGHSQHSSNSESSAPLVPNLVPLRLPS